MFSPIAGYVEGAKHVWKPSGGSRGKTHGSAQRRWESLSGILLKNLRKNIREKIKRFLKNQRVTFTKSSPAAC
jgi:hypothetical protein